MMRSLALHSSDARCPSGRAPPRSALQPKQINEIKDFLLTARRKDARGMSALERACVRVRKGLLGWALALALAAGTSEVFILVAASSARVLCVSARVLWSARRHGGRALPRCKSVRCSSCPNTPFADTRAGSTFSSPWRPTAVRIKKSKNKKTGAIITKFKVRCSKYLYTLVVADTDKADKLKQSLPPGLHVQDLN